MANLYQYNNIARHIAGKYHYLKNIKSKIQRKATDIGFIRKALSHEVTPTFAKVKGQFNNNKQRPMESGKKYNVISIKRTLPTNE